MISLIIFSKDRAMQLDLLLQSIKKYCDLFYDIYVIYNVSNHLFEQGYQKIRETWENVNLVRETSFKANLLDLVVNCQSHVCILCDDCIFFRQVEKVNLNTFCFILGLGEDSVYSGTMNYRFRQPEFIRDDFLTWEWKKADRSEFACPFMFAGNIYTKEDYLACVKPIDYDHPCNLEAACQQVWQRERYHGMPDWCSCPLKQALVHSLNNRVQDRFKSWNGLTFPYSANYLNEAWLNNKKISLEDLDFSQVDGLHKEIDLVIK